MTFKNTIPSFLFSLFFLGLSFAPPYNDFKISPEFDFEFHEKTKTILNHFNVKESLELSNAIQISEEHLLENNFEKYSNTPLESNFSSYNGFKFNKNISQYYNNETNKKSDFYEEDVSIIAAKSFYINEPFVFSSISATVLNPDTIAKLTKGFDLKDGKYLFENDKVYFHLNIKETSAYKQKITNEKHSLNLIYRTKMLQPSIGVKAEKNINGFLQKLSLSFFTLSLIVFFVLLSSDSSERIRSLSSIQILKPNLILTWLNKRKRQKGLSKKEQIKRNKEKLMFIKKRMKENNTLNTNEKYFIENK